MQRFDLLIRNASVLAGTGQPATLADVAVTDGRITEVGTIPPDAQAASTLDAQGLTLSPGFIDIHTHADIALLARPQHLPKVMQGVTTEVFTNCGLGFAPATAESLPIQKEYLLGLFGPDEGVDWGWRTVGDFLDRYERQGIGTNVAYLIPHGAVRSTVMGMAARPADSGEVAEMERLVREGIEQGAWGLSTGLWYATMSYADRAENVAVTRAAGFFATHQRDYGDHIDEATLESIEIAREAGVPVQIAHLQMNGPGNKNRAPDLLNLLDDARSSGVDVTCDTYPYTAGSTFLQSLLPTWATDGGPHAILRRLADADTRAKILTEMEAAPKDWTIYQLVGSRSAANRPYEGERFHLIAEARGLRETEWVCAALEEEELQACYICHASHEGNVRDILQWPGQMIGSDGLHLAGMCHPRLHGTFPRVLGHYARDEKVVSLAEAVRKMTSAPAERLGVKGRGYIRPGMAADMVLFDPVTVSDTATYEEPLRYPTGIPWVWVNGVAVKQDGVATGALAGRVLRRN
jgi:N-acyl-D-amino-acid deacylase